MLVAVSAAESVGDRRPGSWRHVERALRLLGDVKTGDGPIVVALGLQVFVLLTAYYLIKTVREPLILLSGVWGLKGSELKTYGASAQALLLLLLIPLYARVVGRVPRWRLIRGSLLVNALCLVLFIAAGLAGLPIGVPFYIWLGIAGLFSVAQFWSLANDLHERREGERLFGTIAVGGSLGAIAGAQFARWLIGPLGIYGVMAVAAGLNVAAMLLVTVVRRSHRGRRPAAPPHPPSAETAPEIPRSRHAFSLVLHDRYLLLLGVLLLLSNLVNTQGEYILADAVRSHAQAQPEAARAAFIGRFYGTFYSVVNITALFIQALLVSRLFKHAGIRALLFVLPAVALCGYGVIAFVPALAVISTVKAAENGLDYSLQNTLGQALFLPTSREAKYTGKAAVDTTFVRFGDLLAAALVFVGIHALGLSRAGFAVMNVLLVAAWLGTAAAVGWRHSRLAGDEPPRPRGRRRVVAAPLSKPRGAGKSAPSMA
jgi:ATP:ADP antiporter, AAA family